MSSFLPYRSKIAFGSYQDGNDEIYIMNVDGSEQTRLTYNPKDVREGGSVSPSFSPDGSRIAFVSYSDGTETCEIYIMNVDGSGRVNLTDNPADDYSYPFFSPDGSKIAFTSWHDGNDEIYIMNADGSNQTRLTNNYSWDGGPCWSPR